MAALDKEQLGNSEPCFVTKALILLHQLKASFASTNPQHDDRLFIEQFIYTTCT